MLLGEHQDTHHHLFRIRFTELNEIYTVMSLRSFALSMIGIFVPIYLFSNGYGLRQIFAFYLSLYFIEFLFEYFSARLIIKFGPLHVVAFSFPFLITYYWLLKTLNVYHWPLFIIVFSCAITLSFFWQAYHYDFSKTKHSNKATSDVSRLYIILAILGTVGPLVGGFVATSYGISTLFTIVITILLVAIIPLLNSDQSHKQTKFNLKKIKIKNIKRDLISYAGNGMEGATAAVVWPIFVFLIVGSYQKVGIVTSAALILTVIITYTVGKKADMSNRHKYIRIGSTLNGIVYFLQTLASTIVHVFVFNLLGSIVGSIKAAPYTSEYYLHADETSRSEYVFLMESVIDISRVLYFAILFSLTFVFPEQKTILIIGLILGGFGAFLLGLMPPANSEKKNEAN